MLNDISEKANYVPVFVNFSAQTSSIRTQEMVESKLEKKRKNILGESLSIITLCQGMYLSRKCFIRLFFFWEMKKKSLCYNIFKQLMANWYFLINW